MNLYDVINTNRLDVKYNGSHDLKAIDITSVEIDNRSCKDGALFVCIEGYVTDGHKFAQKAVDAGAVAVLAKSPESLAKYGVELNVPVLYVQDTRYALAAVSASLYGNPSHAMSLVGITGTKGKTTTSYMIRAIYKAAGLDTGLIGTICNKIGEEEIPTQRTTPEANVLQALLNKMIEREISTCIMEVSSQGLNLDRVGCCKFSTAIFTNLSKDHIGENEHANMEEYAQAKAKIFTMCNNALINIDNAYSAVMLESARKGEAKIYTYGIDNECDFKAINIEKKHYGVEYDIVYKNEKYHIKVPVPGKFSVYNSLSAFTCAYLEGIAPKYAIEALANVFVPGKAENVPTGKDFSVLIDYAHNPDSFENILTTVNEYAKRTVFLFGCGGDRNRPRALMGETAGKFADFTIITSDNPRSEDPESIVRDIEKGIIPTGADYICIVDRRDAIEYALKNAQPGDVIILAGKGHETEQIFADKTIHFDEREIVREILRGM